MRFLWVKMTIDVLSCDSFIAGFRGSPHTNPEHFWKDSELVLWHLAKSPDENRIIFMGPPFDMSRWTL